MFFTKENMLFSSGCSPSVPHCSWSIISQTSHCAPAEAWSTMGEKRIFPCVLQSVFLPVPPTLMKFRGVLVTPQLWFMFSKLPRPYCGTKLPSHFFYPPLGRNNQLKNISHLIYLYWISPSIFNPFFQIFWVLNNPHVHLQPLPPWTIFNFHCLSQRPNGTALKEARRLWCFTPAKGLVQPQGCNYFFAILPITYQSFYTSSF